MTAVAHDKLKVVERLTGRHLTDRETDARGLGGAAFTSSCGRWHGTVHFDGSCELLNMQHGGPGTPVKVIDNGDGEWQLVPVR